MTSVAASVKVCDRAGCPRQIVLDPHLYVENARRLPVDKVVKSTRVEENGLIGLSVVENVGAGRAFSISYGDNATLAGASGAHVEW